MTLNVNSDTFIDCLLFSPHQYSGTFLSLTAIRESLPSELIAERMDFATTETGTGTGAGGGGNCFTCKSDDNFPSSLLENPHNSSRGCTVLREHLSSEAHLPSSQSTIYRTSPNQTWHLVAIKCLSADMVLISSKSHLYLFTQAQQNSTNLL